MQSTHMPGFTAEAAYYRSGNSYRAAAGRTGPADSGVVPSLVSPNRRCIQGCICVTPEGCPCCDSIFRGVRLPQMQFAMNAGAPNAGANAGSLIDTVDAWCTAHGGGMASMPDGTVQCFL
jgi:hypothetical protein